MPGFCHWRLVVTLPGRGNHGIGAAELSFRTGSTSASLVDAAITSEGVAFLPAYPETNLTDGNTATIGYATPDPLDPGPIGQAEGGSLEIQETFDSYGVTNWDDPGYVGTPGPSGSVQVHLEFNDDRDPDDLLWGQVTDSPGIRPLNLQVWISDPAETRWYLYHDAPAIDSSWPGDWTDRVFPLKNYAAPLFTSELESSHATGFPASITLTTDKAASFTAIGLPEWLTLTGGEISGDVPAGLTDNLIYFFVVAENEAGKNVAVYTFNVVAALVEKLPPDLRSFPRFPSILSSAYPLLIPMDPGNGSDHSAGSPATGIGLRHFGGLANVWKAFALPEPLPPGERGPISDQETKTTPGATEIPGPVGTRHLPSHEILPLAYLTGEGRPDPTTPALAPALGWLSGLWAPTYPEATLARLMPGQGGFPGNAGLAGIPGDVFGLAMEPRTAAFALAGLEALGDAVPLYAPSPEPCGPLARLALLTAGQNFAPRAPGGTVLDVGSQVLAFTGLEGTALSPGLEWFPGGLSAPRFPVVIPLVVGNYGFLVHGDGSVTYTQENIFQFGGRGINVMPYEARTNQDAEVDLARNARASQATRQGEVQPDASPRFIIPGPGESMHTANPDWVRAAIGNRYIPDLGDHPMVGPADLLRVLGIAPGRNRSVETVFISQFEGKQTGNTRGEDVLGAGPEWFAQLGTGRSMASICESLLKSVGHGDGNPIGIEPSAMPTFHLLTGRRVNASPYWEPVDPAGPSDYQDPGAVRSNPTLPWFEYPGRRRYIQPLAENMRTPGLAMDNKWEGLLPPAIVWAPSLALAFHASAINPSFAEDSRLPDTVDSMLDYWSYSGAHRGIAPAGYSVEPVRWFEWLRKRTIASRDPIFIPLDPGLVGFGFNGVIWTWEPLWDERPSQIISRRTIIQAGKSGRENRLGLETRQRLAMSYQWRTVDYRQNPFMTWFIARDYHRNCWMPVWVRQAELTAPFDRDLIRKELRVDKPELFRAGQNAIIWSSWEQWEPLQILAVEPDRIILQNGLAYDWPEGSIVMPMARGRIETPELRYPTSTYAEAEIHFKEL